MNPEPSAAADPAGALHNMSAPPRTSFASVVSPLADRFIVFKLNPPKVRLSRSQLARPVFALELPGIPTLEKIEAAARSLPSFLIGVKLQGDLHKSSRRSARAAVAIAVLSRRVGEIYVRSRQPDYSAGHLFSQQAFAVETWK